MLSKIINHKLFEVFFDKLLIGLVIILAGHMANQSIEKYKLAETQRMAGAAAFVDACQKIWSKVYEFESLTNKAESFDIRFRIAGLANDDEDKEKLPIEIKEHNKLVETKLKEVSSLINGSRFVIGEQFTVHFFKYIGLVKARAEARSTMFVKFNEEAKIAQDAVDAFDMQIASMRFSDGAAREYAISQIPH